MPQEKKIKHAGKQPNQYKKTRQFYFFFWYLKLTTELSDEQHQQRTSRNLWKSVSMVE
jgi:hypothetical protein